MCRMPFYCYYHDAGPAMDFQPPKFKQRWCNREGSQAALGDFDQLVEGPWPFSTRYPPRGPPGAGKCILAGELVETTPVSGSKYRPAGRRPFHTLQSFGPSAREIRPFDQLASPGILIYIIPHEKSQKSSVGKRQMLAALCLRCIWLRVALVMFQEVTAHV
jgi:hypothetical protein